MMTLLFTLLAGHALADFALQSDFMAKGKNRHSIPPGYDPALHGPRQTIWPYVLTAHSLIHGMMVMIITGVPALGILETIAHWIIDFGKCEKWYGIHRDQALHIACKLLWIMLLLIARMLSNVQQTEVRNDCPRFSKCIIAIPADYGSIYATR